MMVLIRCNDIHLKSHQIYSWVCTSDEKKTNSYRETLQQNSSMSAGTKVPRRIDEPVAHLVDIEPPGSMLQRDQRSAPWLAPGLAELRPVSCVCSSSGTAARPRPAQDGSAAQLETGKRINRKIKLKLPKLRNAFENKTANIILNTFMHNSSCVYSTCCPPFVFSDLCWPISQDQSD